MSDYIEEVLLAKMPGEDYLNHWLDKGRCPVASRSKPARANVASKQYRLSGLLSPLKPDQNARYNQMFPGCGFPAAVKPRMSARRRAWRAR